MTSIGSINGVTGATPATGGAADARTAALGTIGEIGQRVLAWVSASGGAGGDPHGTLSTPSGFRPDAQALARGGDVYGLGEIGRDLAAQFGGTPAEQGGLNRAIEGFTREAVIQLAGLSGAGPDRQLAGVREALAAAGDAAAPDGIDGLTQRLDAATALLARQNGR